MSDGTPLDALENGDIENAADAEKMQAILSDINASGADIGRGQQSTQAMQQTMPQAMQSMQQPMQPMPMQPMQPMPPMMMHAPPQYQEAPPQYQHHYVPVDEPDYKPKKKKTNIWTSILERIRDPIFVILIVFLVSLPVLHTFAAKHAAWAFAVGGQLSWFGLTAVSLLAGILFGVYRATSDVLGL
jgi:hypothetical protein